MTNTIKKSDALKAICGIINKWRLSNGWQILDAKEAELAGLAWVEILTNAGIKPEQYNGLYQQALQMRAHKLSQGQETPPFNAELLVAAHRANQSQPNQSAKPPQDCPRCYGTGWLHRHDSAGKVLGVDGRCEHA